MMRERDIERYLDAQVRRVGGTTRKVRFIGRRGAPDRVVMLPGGRLVWVELKRPGEKPEAHQLREHARLAALGQVVAVIDSYAGVENFINAF